MKLLTAELAKDSNLQYKDLQRGKKKKKKKWELVLRQSTVVKKIIKVTYQNFAGKKRRIYMENL